MLLHQFVAYSTAVKTVSDSHIENQPTDRDMCLHSDMDLEHID